MGRDMKVVGSRITSMGMVKRLGLMELCTEETTSMERRMVMESSYGAQLDSTTKVK